MDFDILRSLSYEIKVCFAKRTISTSILFFQSSTSEAVLRGSTSDKQDPNGEVCAK